MKFFLFRNLISIISYIILATILNLLGWYNVITGSLLFIFETLMLIRGAYIHMMKPMKEMIQLVDETDWESDEIDFDKFDEIQRGSFAFNLNILIEKYKFLVNIIEKKQGVVHNLNYLSEHDELTGCYNRIKLDKKRHRYENAYTTTIIYIDVNNLKLMNDTFGHESGDAILKRASKQLAYWLVYGDLYRLGGDEFMIVILDKDEEEISSLLNTWYKNLNILNREKDGFICNLSYGIASKTKSQKISLDELITYADIKMYEMKKKLKENDYLV